MKEGVNQEALQVSSNKQDAAARASYNVELSKEFSNVVLKPLTDKDSDTSEILHFKTIEEYKAYLRKDPFVIKKGEPVKTQAVMTKSDLELINRNNPAVIKPLISSNADGESGSFIAGWSQAVPIRDYEGFSIGLSAIVSYSASYQSNKWYKKITSVGSLAASGGRDVNVSNPGLGGSERIRINPTGVESSIIYQGYAAQVVANVQITQTTTIGIGPSKSTAEKTVIRIAQGTINSETLPDPPPVE